MALDLSEFVCYGAINARKRNRVGGWIGLAGMREQIRLELSGNCEPDLAGKEVWFRVRSLGKADFDERSVPSFQHRQIGIAGKVTAAFKTPFGANGQPLDTQVAGPDTDWRPCLHVEWFGQHGRTLVEIRDVVLMEATSVPEDQDAFYGALFEDEELEPPPEPEPMTPWTPEVLDDPFGSDFPFEGTGEDYMRDLEVLDDIIEHPGETIPLRDALADEIKFLAPDELDENRANHLLRLILARLAVSSIAFDMCEHVTAVEAYRLLYERTVDSRNLRELAGTVNVLHMSTYDDCPECEAEFLRDWAELDAKLDAQRESSDGPGNA
jgi:hypothetical protein